MRFHEIVKGNENGFKNCRICILQSSVYFLEYPIIDLVATIHQSESTVDVRLRQPKSQPCYDAPSWRVARRGVFAVVLRKCISD